MHTADSSFPIEITEIAGDTLTGSGGWTEWAPADNRHLFVAIRTGPADLGICAEGQRRRAEYWMEVRRGERD
jgi:hypothetical protein